MCIYNMYHRASSDAITVFLRMITPYNSSTACEDILGTSYAAAAPEHSTTCFVHTSMWIMITTAPQPKSVCGVVGVGGQRTHVL